jgi:hypothetical protein
MGGNVTGPVSSTDTAIARWNGTGGNVIEDSVVLVDSSGNITGVASIGSNVSLSGNPTTTTQSPNDNSTKIATTAYVDAGLGGATTLTHGQVYIGNSSNVATGRPVTGDISISDTGVTSIGATKVAASMLFTNLIIEDFGITIDGGDYVPTTGSNGFITIPYSGTINNWYLAADASGSCVIDIKRSGTSIVGGGNKPTLSSAQTGNAAVSGWTSTTITAGDIIEFNLNSISTIKRVNLVIKLTRT